MRKGLQPRWIGSSLTVSKGQTSHKPIILPKPAIQGLFIWVLHCALPAWLERKAQASGSKFGAWTREALEYFVQASFQQAPSTTGNEPFR